MTCVPSFSLRFVSACLGTLGASLALSGCDSESGAPKPTGTGTDTKKPPGQRAVALRSKGGRPAGTRFNHTAALTMGDANLLTTVGDETVAGKVTTMLLDKWDLSEISPTERQFRIREMSLTNVTTFKGRPKEDRTESTLAGIVFEVTRADETSGWKLSPPERKLTHLQEIDLKMLGNLWDDGTDALYPEQPVELRQSWKADPKAFGMIVSPRLKVDDGAVTCKLDQITVMEGERCAAITVDIDITGVFEMAGDSGIQVQIALTGTIFRSIEKFFDMRTELKGSMQMEMAFPEDDTTITIDGVAEFTQTAKLKKSLELAEKG